MPWILIIVFGPLFAAVIAGLGNRMLGNTVAKSLTTGALFVSMAIWPIPFPFGVSLVLVARRKPAPATP